MEVRRMQWAKVWVTETPICQNSQETIFNRISFGYKINSDSPCPVCLNVNVSCLVGFHSSSTGLREQFLLRNTADPEFITGSRCADENPLQSATQQQQEKEEGDDNHQRNLQNRLQQLQKQPFEFKMVDLWVSEEPICLCNQEIISRFHPKLSIDNECPYCLSGNVSCLIGFHPSRRIGLQEQFIKRKNAEKTYSWFLSLLSPPQELFSSIFINTISTTSTSRSVKDSRSIDLDDSISGIAMKSVLIKSGGDQSS